MQRHSRLLLDGRKPRQEVDRSICVWTQSNAGLINLMTYTFRIQDVEAKHSTSSDFTRGNHKETLPLSNSEGCRFKADPGQRALPLGWVA